MAYAAVISAKRKIGRLYHPSQSKILLPSLEMKSIYKELQSLESILAKFAEMLGSNLRFDPLEQQVQDLAYQIDDLMECFRSSDAFYSESPSEGPGTESNQALLFSRELLKVKEEILSLSEKLNKYKKDYENMDKEKQQDTAEEPASSRRINDYVGERKLVGLDDNEVKKLSDWAKRESSNFEIMSVGGFDGEVRSLLDWVNGESSMLEIMGVVGRVGIGDTSLVWQVFEDPSLQQQFSSHRFWVTLGPDCKLHELQVAYENEKGYHHIHARYKERRPVILYDMDDLYKILSEQRYVIVLNDLWSIQAWDYFRVLLPRNNDKNRVILTTRFPNVAYDIGKQIVRNREGPPLPIPAVGEHQPIALEAANNAVSFSSRIFDFNESRLVGLDDEAMELMRWIFSGSPVLEVMSVVGMVGIGKTTLVQQIYDHPIVQDYFDCCFWVTIGPNYKQQEFIRLVLDHIRFQLHGIPEKYLGNHQSRKFLRKFLSEKRYLIVLDDIWSIHVWKDLSRILPVTENRCRIILTTRLANLHFGVPSQWRVYDKHFLNDEDSWNLLHGVVFATGEHCSYELQKYGKRIAKNCEGLPLAIIAVGKHLRMAEKTVEYWKKVSEQENLYDIIKDDYENISARLFLSYKMLPRRLKECFLYIGIVPNYEIFVSILLKLWCAEEFFESQRNKSVEDIAEEYLHELVSKNVVLVREWRSQIGRIKRCGIHFVFRYLCVTEAAKERFCLALKKHVKNSSKGTNFQDRLCIHNIVLLGIKEALKNIESIAGVRSLLCLGPLHNLLQVRINFKLLKVLNAISIRFYKFPHQVLELVRLKFLAITYDGNIPESISQLWNLEVLIVGRHQCIISPDFRAFLPMAIWDLKWLKHLRSLGMDLSDPCVGANGLEHLITLSGVGYRSCSQGVLARVPNLKKLGICIELALDEVLTFNFLRHVAEQLHNLQSFKCVVRGFISQIVAAPHLEYPHSLTKLTLSGCRFSWAYMSTIGSLPYLEVLKLRSYAFCGPRWETGEAEFLCLKVLLLEDLDIEEWIADNFPFPRLGRLIIRHCYKLQNIPPTIGSWLKNKTIELDDCSPSLLCSAKQIQKMYRAPEAVQISAKFSWEDKKKHKLES